METITEATRKTGDGNRQPVIVVGVDHSPQSETALRWAADEARRRGAELHVVHAWEPMVTGTLGPREGGAADVQEKMALFETADIVQWAATILTETAPELGVSVEPVEGHAGPVLVDASAGADMLVLGTGEHTGLRRFVFGSVSRYCGSHSTCPVVIVPTPAPERETPVP